jgi:hypothetical protein
MRNIKQRKSLLLVRHHLEILSEEKKLKSGYSMQKKNDLQLGIHLENMLSDLRQSQYFYLRRNTKSTPLAYLRRGTSR